MSVTQCRRCDQPITFVLRDDGRWRPVEVTFEELSAEGNELLTTQKQGSWQALSGVVRVYRVHVCIEDPSWNQGRPKLRVRTDVGEVDVDELTGEIAQPVWQDEPECPHLSWERSGTSRRCTDCREYLGIDQSWREERDAKLAYRKQRDMQRRAAKESPWPPEPGGYGYDQMREWLSHHVMVLTGGQ